MITLATELGTLVKEIDTVSLSRAGQSSTIYDRITTDTNKQTENTEVQQLLSQLTEKTAVGRSTQVLIIFWSVTQLM